jgi:hypothetical protein
MEAKQQSLDDMVRNSSDKKKRPRSDIIEYEPRGNSWVWGDKRFKKATSDSSLPVKGKRAQCQICMKWFDAENGTKSLIKHLEKVHALTEDTKPKASAQPAGHHCSFTTDRLLQSHLAVRRMSRQNNTAAAQC